MVKPLDLNVGIQNSYEAARSEAARLDRPQVLGHLQNQDSAKQQVARDHQVSSLESAMLHQNLFAEDAYDPPDYDFLTPEQRKKRRQSQKSAPTKSETEIEESPAEGANETHDGGFSTFA